MVWKLLPTISAPMPFQMALDELLFESHKENIQDPALRFYVSSGPWISTGYSFKTPSELQGSALIRKHPRTPVCRRVTGGGCVFHGKDLIFSLVARYAGVPSPLDSVRTSYGKLHEGVKIALQKFNLEPRVYSSQEVLPKGRDCFSFPVVSDLSWKGRKIAGGAQKRSNGVLLHHESIQIPEGVGRNDLIRAVREGLETVFEVIIQDTDFDPAIFFEAEQCEKDRRLKTGD